MLADGFYEWAETGNGKQPYRVVANDEPFDVTVQPLVQKRQSVAGWPSGDARDSQSPFEFSALRDIGSMVETYSLEEAGEAYERMLESEARFRSVIEP